MALLNKIGFDAHFGVVAIISKKLSGCFLWREQTSEPIRISFVWAVQMRSQQLLKRYCEHRWKASLFLDNFFDVSVSMFHLREFALRTGDLPIKLSFTSRCVSLVVPVNVVALFQDRHNVMCNIFGLIARLRKKIWKNKGKIKKNATMN